MINHHVSCEVIKMSEQSLQGFVFPNEFIICIDHHCYSIGLQRLFQEQPYLHSSPDIGLITPIVRVAVRVLLSYTRVEPQLQLKLVCT